MAQAPLISANAPNPAPGLISEHGAGQNLLPKTTPKPPPATKPAPKPNPPGGAPPPPPQGPMDMPSWLAQYGLTEPTDLSQQDITNMVKAAIQPILDEYNNQLTKMQNDSKTTQTFQTNAAMQLGDWLKALGDTNYTPTVAALLGQQTTRIQNYNDRNAETDLYNSLIGGSQGINAQIPGIIDKLTAQNQDNNTQRLNYANAYQSYLSDYNSSQAAAQKDYIGNLSIAGAMMKQYAGSVPPPAIQQYLSQTLGYKPGSVIPLNYNGKAPTVTKLQTKQIVVGGKTYWATFNPVTQQWKNSGILAKDPSGGSVNLQTKQIYVNGKTYWATFNPKTHQWVNTNILAKGPKAGSSTLKGPGGGKALTTYELQNLVAGWKAGKRSSDGTVSRSVTSKVYVDAKGQPVKDPKDAATDPATGKPRYKTVTNYESSNGTTVGKLQYGAAYSRLRAMGYTDPTARRVLNGYYARGEQGRAWLTNEERAKLSAAGALSAAHLYKRVAYLDPTQAAALGLTPPSNLGPNDKVMGPSGLTPGYWIQGSIGNKKGGKDLGPIFVIEGVH